MKGRTIVDRAGELLAEARIACRVPSEWRLSSDVCDTLRTYAAEIGAFPWPGPDRRLFSLPFHVDESLPPNSMILTEGTYNVR